MPRTKVRTSAKDLAYEHLKSRIASIGLRDGSFITEAEIAAELGISRTPVREALLRLEGDGLLRLLPQKGAFVPPVSDKEVDEVMEMREAIETYCAGRVAREAIDLAGELRLLLDDQRGLAGDPEAFIDRDRLFHERIVSACGNTLLTENYHALRDRQMRMGIRAVLHTDRAAHVIAEHEHIVDALASHDEDATVDAVRTHLRNTLAVLKEESPW